MWPLIKILPVKTNFNFVRFARLAAIISAIAAIASLSRAMIPFELPCGGLTCGIDFEGGTVLELSTNPRPVDLGVARASLERMNLGDVQVQAFGTPNQAMVRFQTPSNASPAATVDAVKATLTKSLGNVKFERTDVVGPKVSGE